MVMDTKFLILILVLSCTAVPGYSQDVALQGGTILWEIRFLLHGVW